MAIYVYNSSTGELVSWCPDDSDPVADDATLVANGLASVKGLPALAPDIAWNAATKTTETVTPPPVPNFIPAYEFIQLFTAAEAVAIKASADPMAQKFMLMLSVAPPQGVDLNGAIIQGGIAYLASISLIQPERVSQILAGQIQVT